MDFDNYAACAVTLAVDLVNSDAVSARGELLTGPKALRAFLAEHNDSYRGPITATDVEAVRRLRPRVRAVFVETEVAAAAARLNELIATAGTLPQLTSHDGEPWHLHFTAPGAPLADRVAAESAMGLAVVLRDHGLERMRTCASETCEDVFVDTSRNRSRRYCSAEVCGNRANVAAYRARQRAGTSA